MVPSPCLRMLLNRLDKGVVRTEDGGIWALCRGCKLLSSNPASGETPKPPSSFSGQSCRALDPQSTATVHQSWGVICRGNSRGESPSPDGQQPCSTFQPEPDGPAQEVREPFGVFCMLPGKLQANPCHRLPKSPCPCSTRTKLHRAASRETPGSDALVGA